MKKVMLFALMGMFSVGLFAQTQDNAKPVEKKKEPVKAEQTTKAAKPATEVKAVTKDAAKPATKEAVKTTAKETVKPATKDAAKPATKEAVKTVKATKETKEVAKPAEKKADTPKK